MKQRLAAALMAMTLLATACGSSGSDEAAPEDVASDTADSSGAEQPPSDDVEPESPEPSNGEEAEVPAPTGYDVTAWTNWERGSIVAQPAGATIDERLTAMYVDLVRFLDTDPRLFTGPALEDHEPSDRRVHPATLLAMFGETASFTADAFDLVGAHAAAAVASGDPASITFFERRAGGAPLMADLQAAGFDAALGQLNASTEAQQCFIEELVAITDCRDSDAAAALTDLANDTWRAFNDFDIDDASSDFISSVDGFDQRVRLCDAWDSAVAEVGLTPERENRIWLAIDDNLLETRFIDWEECDRLDAGEGEPIPDEAPNRAALDAYLRGLADAGEQGGFTEDLYDLGGGTDAERAEYTQITDNARTLIIAGAIESASQQRLLPNDPDVIRALTLVANLDPNYDPQTGADQEFDWDAVEDLTCEIWFEILDERPADVADAIDFSISQLFLRDAVLPGAC